MLRQYDLKQNKIKCFHFNAPGLHQQKDLVKAFRKKPTSIKPVIIIVLMSHAQQINFTKCLHTSIFEASDEVLMMRPTTYFFIPCNQTDIRKTLLALTHKTENTSCHDMLHS